LQAWIDRRRAVEGWRRSSASLEGERSGITFDVSSLFDLFLHLFNIRSPLPPFLLPVSTHRLISNNSDSPLLPTALASPGLEHPHNAPAVFEEMSPSRQGVPLSQRERGGSLLCTVCCRGEPCSFCEDFRSEESGFRLFFVFVVRKRSSAFVPLSQRPLHRLSSSLSLTSPRKGELGIRIDGTHPSPPSLLLLSSSPIHPPSFLPSNTTRNRPHILNTALQVRLPLSSLSPVPLVPL
jgi:hypothetical protein